jgi:Flp pilus assembly protein TadB
MARTSTLRASDADREAIAAQLHKAAVEGRLDADELEERLHLALRARTYGDLRRLVVDLPAQPTRWEPRRRSSMAPLAFALALRVAVAVAVVAVAIVVIVATAMWWLAWLVVWMLLSGRRYGVARPRSKALPTSMRSFTMPNCRSHAAHFSRTSSRSWP